MIALPQNDRYTYHFVIKQLQGISQLYAEYKLIKVISGAHEGKERTTSNIEKLRAPHSAVMITCTCIHQEIHFRV